MSTQPKALSPAEWNEIGELEAVRESWGVEQGENFADFAVDNIYGVKFDFISRSPGYSGDLFILQGDNLMGDPPFMLIRDKAGKIDLCDFG